MSKTMFKKFLIDLYDVCDNQVSIETNIYMGAVMQCPEAIDYWQEQLELRDTKSFTKQYYNSTGRNAYNSLTSKGYTDHYVVYLQKHLYIVLNLIKVLKNEIPKSQTNIHEIIMNILKED